MISPETEETVKNELENAIHSNNFSKWLSSYFSTPTYDDLENIQKRSEPLSDNELLNMLRNGNVLYKPDHIKLVITTSQDGSINLSVYGTVITITSLDHKQLVYWLNQDNKISISNVELFDKPQDIMTVITHLFNQNVLFFENEDLTLS
ncbi:MAG: hypothetical protein CMH31_02225 [Micavibrio sp.]|nr:hypothetical protein [Micavibrio sp.]